MLKIQNCKRSQTRYICGWTVLLHIFWAAWWRQWVFHKITFKSQGEDGLQRQRSKELLAFSKVIMLKTCLRDWRSSALRVVDLKAAILRKWRRSMLRHVFIDRLLNFLVNFFKCELCKWKTVTKVILALNKIVRTQWNI